MDILRSIWNVIQYQVLGMRWLNGWMGRLVVALGLDPARANVVILPPVSSASVSGHAPAISTSPEK